MAKVVWSVDGTGSSKKSLGTALRAVRAFWSKADAEVLPVYVLTPNPLALGALSETLRTRLESYREAAEKALAKAMKPFASQVLPGKVVLEEGSLTRNAVDRLIETAKAEGAQMILLSTHASEGLERLFLGSFAETALLRSKIPLLIVNPKNPPAQRVKTILLPTDLSARSFQYFEKVLAHAKRLKAKVILYQKLVLPVQPLLSAGSLLIGGAPIQMEIFAQERALKADQEAGEWIRRGKEAGVKVEWVLDRKAGTVKEGILRAARSKKAQLIAMTSSTGMIEATLVGSIARQVVREARCPVWVLHT